MQKSESPSDDKDKRNAELAQVLLELDAFERETSARFSLIRRRLMLALGGKRASGPKVFEMRGPDGKARVINMRGLAEE